MWSDTLTPAADVLQLPHPVAHCARDAEAANRVRSTKTCTGTRHLPERVSDAGGAGEAGTVGTASGRCMSSGRVAAGRIAARRPVDRTRPVRRSFFARL